MSVFTSAKELGNLEMKLTLYWHSLSGEKSTFFWIINKKEDKCVIKVTNLCTGGLRRPSDFLIILDQNKTHLAEAAAVFSGTFVADLSFNLIFHERIT